MCCVSFQSSYRLARALLQVYLASQISHLPDLRCEVPPALCSLSCVYNVHFLQSLLRLRHSLWLGFKALCKWFYISLRISFLTHPLHKFASLGVQRTSPPPRWHETSALALQPRASLTDIPQLPRGQQSALRAPSAGMAPHTLPLGHVYWPHHCSWSALSFTSK